MLILSRRVGENIILADDIRVTVLAIRGKQVQLGFTAPVSVPIRRAELCGLPSNGDTAPPRRRPAAPRMVRPRRA
jgi:carbon storage regulator